jgi:hypothetical protein
MDGPFGFIAIKTLNNFLSNLSILTLPDEGYSRNVRTEFDI